LVPLQPAQAVAVQSQGPSSTQSGVQQALATQTSPDWQCSWASVHPQALPTQARSEACALQSVHAPPSGPQWASRLQGSQAPWSHRSPAGQGELQLPPQPSSAPPHFPTQSGVQPSQLEFTHWEPDMQSEADRHPQLPATQARLVPCAAQF
jgi:hypothetical protein